MGKADPKKVISGYQVELYVNGRQIAEADSINAKAEFKKEEMNFLSEFYTQNKIVAGSIKGSITETKANSYAVKDLEPAINGRAPFPEGMLMFVQRNEYGKEERACLTGVVWDDLTFINIESGSPSKHERPFTATGYKLIETLE